MKVMIGLSILAATVFAAMMYLGVQLVGPSAPRRIVSERLLVRDFPSIGQVTISPDGRRVAYTEGNGLVVEGITRKQYGFVEPESLIFSPDSKRLAYTVRTGNKWFVVVDGIEGEQYQRSKYVKNISHFH